MKKTTILFVLFVCLLQLSAQRAIDGENYFNNKQYAKARDVYEALLRQKPSDALFNYRIARCYYELKNPDLAIKHFEMAGTKYPLRDMYLGELYFNAYRFDESVMAYQTYLATLKPDDSRIADFQQKIKNAELAARYLSRVEDIAIVDTISVNKAEFLKFYKFSSELGSLHIEPIKLVNRRIVDKVKYTTQRQDRIYFSDSIRGQTDIFTSFKLLDEWTEPKPLPNSINTRANENYPFLLLDGVTLYFASDGENSMGGYDLFITRYTPSSDSFLTPENIGMPFNSIYNDYMMVIDEQHQIGWFASDRFQPTGKVMIYAFVPNSIKTILRSEDKEYIRKQAKLKMFRKAKKVQTIDNESAEKQWEESEDKIELVINDTLIYTTVSQFQSQEALKLWMELSKMSTEYKQKELELENLRTQYSLSEMLDERNRISVKIIELEKQIPGMKKLLNEQRIKVRNAEIIYLEKML
jgi:tetratricopeptide (TPR) repeat protein